jgi:hypothetical protein
MSSSSLHFGKVFDELFLYLLKESGLERKEIIDKKEEIQFSQFEYVSLEANQVHLPQPKKMNERKFFP